MRAWGGGQQELGGGQSVVHAPLLIKSVHTSEDAVRCFRDAILGVCVWLCVCVFTPVCVHSQAPKPRLSTSISRAKTSQTLNSQGCT